MVTLPQELVDQIVDCIVQGDEQCAYNLLSWRDPRPASQQDTLRTCTLVCRTWLASSSHYLLDRAFYRADHARDLAWLMKACPIVSQNVQTLVIACKDIAARDIAELCPLLPKLRNMSITVTDTTYKRERQRNVPLCTLPRPLSKLHVSGSSSGHLRDILRLFEVIDRLYVIQVGKATPHNSSHEATHHLRVDKLSISGCHPDIFEVMQSSLASACLRSFTLGNGEACDNETLSGFIQNACSQVRSVTYQFDGRGLRQSHRAFMLLYERKFSLCDLRATHIVLAWDKIFGIAYMPLESPFSHDVTQARRLRIALHCQSPSMRADGNYTLIKKLVPLSLRRLPAVTDLDVGVVCAYNAHSDPEYKQQAKEMVEALRQGLHPDLASRVKIDYVGVIPQDW